MRTYRKLSEFIRISEALDNSKKNYMETVFLDEELLGYAIEFYNLYFGYKDHPIDRAEALAYANLGVRLNADLFKSMFPFDESKLDYFYRMTPFYFFHDIIRFMDGYHLEEINEIMEKCKPPVLDFAGGTGGYSIILAKNKIDVTFFESNLMQLNWMKWLCERFKLRVQIESDSKKLERKYNLIIAKDIVEHVLDPGKLNEWLETLKLEEGVLFLTQMPCCGPEEFAPMHFKIDLEGSKMFYSVEDNLKYLQKYSYT